MRRLKAKILLQLLRLTLALLSGCATPSGIGDNLGLDPNWEWKTLETEHFRVTFPAELQDVANRSANYLEEAHASLSKVLLWTPHDRTQVLVIDNEDAANGLTTPVGRFGMVFYATPPDNWFSTSYYDDWLRLLAFHEYTHFLNMDVTRDYSDILRKVFGDILLPNSLWPSWMLEGLAVYMETRYTHAGRGRSPLYEMILRSAVEANVLDTDKFVPLDRVNGTNPYYPGGETPYFFGYGMMSQIGRSQESHLGEMSWRSGGRVPFLINGNLQEISGKDWYQIWNDWMKEARARTEAELASIRSRGVTPFTRITAGGRQTLGSTVSPDGKWLAYTQETQDKRFSIWLKDLKAGDQARALPVAQKILGASIAFTPDSKAIVHSSLRRRGYYTLFSDLAVYDIERGTTEWLSKGLRARDPDVSSDGKQVVFTLTQKATIGLAIAPLELEDGHYRLGPIQVAYMPAEYDAVYTPKFSKDGKSIYFSQHRNGKAQEDLMALDLESGKTQELVSDRSFNRFPAVHPDGDLYFVSDATGVDNLYRYRPGAAVEAVTNMTTGVAFPSFAPTGRLFANVFSFSGWDVAEIDTASTHLPADPAKVERAPAPAPDADSVFHQSQQDYPVNDYSVFPSLWPRQWAPLFLLNPGSAWIGGEVIGFDAIDRHRYLAAIAYDTQVQKPDTLLYYANRSLGPTLTFSVENRTTDTYTASDTSLLAYTRKTKFHFDISYPYRWTYSALTPALAINTERNALYTLSATGFEATAFSRFVPSVDGILAFSNTQSSPLAITPEMGRSTVVAARSYIGLDQAVWKGLIKDTEYIHLGEHSVLIPSAKWSWVSALTSYGPAAVNVQGRINTSVTAGLPADNLDQLALRGYPDLLYYAKSAGVFSLDFRFPLLRIYRGWGTNPAYLDSIYGFTFAELGYFPGANPTYSTLPSVGGGMRLSGELLIHLPLLISTEYHQGLNQNAGGTGQFIFQLGFGGISF